MMTTADEELIGIEDIGQGYEAAVPSDLNKEYTMDEYLEMVQNEDPKVLRSSHQRVADAIEHYGTDKQDRFKLWAEDPLNNGEKALLGDEIHEALEETYKKVKSGARGLGPENRIKLGAGPVGSAKSQAHDMLQEYFADYTKRDDGKMYTFKWVNLNDALDFIAPEDSEVPSKTAQDPIVLVPDEPIEGGRSMRDQVLENANRSLEEDSDYPYTMRNDQAPDPVSQFLLTELVSEYEEETGSLSSAWQEVMDNHVVVERYVSDQSRQQASGTLQPKDKKNQDVTELTGEKNHTKAAMYGEGNPLSFEYSGAFPNANRGIFSGEELLKLQREFLYEFLHAAQEGEMKVGNQARADIDQVILGRTNMPEYRDKLQDDTMEAFFDRSKIIEYPYNLQYNKEAEIYEQNMENGDTDDFHFEPHTFEMAGLLAVMSRIEEPATNNQLDILDKARVLNGEDLGDKDYDIRELKEEDAVAGMAGISTRFFMDEIAEALEEVDLDVDEEKGVKSVFPVELFNLYRDHLPNHGSIRDEEMDKYRNYIEQVEEEYKERATDDVRAAVAYDVDEIERQGEKYFDHVLAYLSGETVEDEVTGREKEPDDDYLARVEDAADIPEDMQDEFRTEISNWISRRSRENESYSPLENTRLRRALEQKIWEEKKQNINFDALVSSASSEERSEWIDTLTEEMGYSEPGAEKVLKFAGAEVARDDLEG